MTAALVGPLNDVSARDQLAGLLAVAGPDKMITAQGADAFVQAANAYNEAQRSAGKKLTGMSGFLYGAGLAKPNVDFPAIVRKLAKPNG
jgi:hypothetical protein